MRKSLLVNDPGIDPVSLPVLQQVARDIERESLERYDAMARMMERRGEVATAAAFRVMLEEERKHVDAVERWTLSLGTPAPDGVRFQWRVPADLTDAWNEFEGSARLTPYRAFAIAVDNEQRAFALYSYLAAHASDARVAAEAERLALEELRHASLMRRWRRQAWHRERQPRRDTPAPPVASPDALHALLAEREAEIGARLRAVAARLRARGDADSAQLLEYLADTPSWPVPRGASVGAEVPVASDDPVHLLVAAQEPLEALSETLEALMPATQGELFAEVERAMTNVVSRLARLALRTSQQLQPARAAG